MAKSNRAYKSAKRNRELLRQKKQAEKRRRRLAKDKKSPGGGGFAPNEDTPISQGPESR